LIARWNMSHLIRCCLAWCVVGLSGVALAEQPPQVTIVPSANQAALERETQATAEVALKLHQSRLDFSAEDEPLEQALQRIAEAVGVAIDLDRNQFSEVNVKVDSPVSIHLKDVRAENVLRILLRPLKLVPVARAGHVIVTSEEGEEDHFQTTRYYPLRDLMIDGEGQFDDGDSIIDMLTTSLVPESWEELGGPATVYPFEGGLSISQSHPLHQAIEQLFAALREIQAMPNNQYDVTPRLLVADPEEHARTRAAVRSRTVTLKADELPLEAIIEHLANETDLNIVLDSAIIKQREIAERPMQEVIEARRVEQVVEARRVEQVVEPRRQEVVPEITGNWQDRPLEQILDYLSLNHDLPWTIEGNVVRIADMIERRLHRPPPSPLLVKVYPIADLGSHRDRPPVNPWNHEHMQFLEAETWRVYISSRYPITWPPSDWHSAMDPYDHLVDCIETTIRTESWESLGGPGTTFVHPGLDCLVVAQELARHEDVERLLQQIRANRQTIDQPNADDPAEADDPILVRSYFFLADPHTGKLLLDSSEFEQLCRRAAKLIEPDSWDDDAMFMEILTDRVVVRHRASVQRQLDQFFNATNLITGLDPTDARQVRGFRFTPIEPTPSKKDD